MPLALEICVASLKAPATLLIVPVPVTLVAALNVMPEPVFVASLKPEAPVIVVESAAVNPLNVIPPAAPVVAPVTLNVVLPMPVIDPPADDVAAPAPLTAPPLPAKI